MDECVVVLYQCQCQSQCLLPVPVAWYKLATYTILRTVGVQPAPGRLLTLGLGKAQGRMFGT
eukprot:1153961-Pelagomonas_calceolata.AAC.13